MVIAAPPPGIETLTPGDKAGWLRARGKDVTASVIGALFNVHEFQTPYSLWAVKTGRVPRDTEEGPAMRRGRLLEPVAVQIIREERPDWQVHHNAAENVYFRDPVARIGATPDVLAISPERGLGVVQIKSVEAGVYRRKWLPEGGDGLPEPPLWIVLQAILEAHLTGARWAAVAPLVIGHGVDLPILDIPLDHMDGVISEMKARVAEFWQMVAEGREPDPDYERDAALIDRVYEAGDAREEIDLTGDERIIDLIETVHRANAEAKRLLAVVEASTAEIKHRMGKAEVGHIDGGRTITWKTQRRRLASGAVALSRTLRLPKI